MSIDPKAAKQRLAQLKSARSTHESLWQEIADYMIPSRAFSTTHAPGSKRSARIFNTHSVLALEQLAGGLHGMLTSPALKWFKLRPAPELARDRAALAWFEAAGDIMDGYFKAPASGFGVALHETYLEVAGPGSGVVFTADKGRRGPRFQSIPLAECYYAENADRQVDTLYREYHLPLREVLRLWPDTAPEALRRKAAKSPDEPTPLTHATEPDGRGGWNTLWCQQEHYLEHGRYQEFPFAVPRWSLRSGETYGAGCGVNALADVKMLNKAEELNLRALAKAVDPPMALPDDGFLNAPNMNPGALNYLRTDTRGMDRMGPIQTGARPDLAFQFIEMVQERISGIFYTTWLRLPQQPNMTATEVLQRRDELLRLLGPMVERLEAELLSPLIERSFAILLRNGLFPPLPASLARGGGWWVEYQGPLSRAQRLADAETVMRWFGALQPLVQADPTILDAIDTDAAAQYLGDRHGAPASLMRSAEQIAARRADRASQQQQMAQAEMLASGAGAAKDGAAALATLAGIQGGGAPA
jgi:hypothetical protein